MNPKNTQFSILLLSGVLLIFAASFRILGKDIDYQHYLNMYNYGFHEQESSKELSFVFFRYATHQLFNESFTSFLMIYAILGVTIKLTAIHKLSPLPILSLFLYAATYYPLHEYTQIRAGVAAGIILLATKDMANRNDVAFLIKTALAMLFHWVSLVAMIVWAAFKFLPLKVIYALPIAGLVLAALINLNENILLTAFTNIPYAHEYYQNHAGHTEEFNTFNVLFMLNATWWLFILISTPKEILYNKNIFTALFSMLSISIFIYLSTSQLNLPVISHRLFEFLNVSTIILFPYFVCLKKNKAIPIAMTAIYGAAILTHLTVNVNILPELT